MTPAKMSSLLRMYGEEVDVYRGSDSNTYLKQSSNGFIIKDMWAYTAGFVDADGSIFIERGDPRVTIVASGDNGKSHCEELQKKMIGMWPSCIRPKSWLKTPVKPVHRLIFSSKKKKRYKRYIERDYTSSKS